MAMIERCRRTGPPDVGRARRAASRRRTGGGRNDRTAVLISPMLATLGTVPTGPGWAYEFKWDGVRAISYLQAAADTRRE
jgi:ATP-dependent DNA ligase